MKKLKLIFTVALLSLALSSCSGVKQQLGVGRNSPDEFTVVKRAPLTLPPDYSLRPPDEGRTFSSSTVSDQAKTALMGASSASVSKGSAENILLQKMGAGNADPAIRATINRENGYLALENQSVADKLIFWENEAEAQQEMPASVVDAQKESERLKKNAEEGKPATEGTVPVIEKKKGTIDKLF